MNKKKLNRKEETAMARIREIDTRGRAICATSPAEEKMLTKLMNAGHLRFVGWTERLDHPNCRRMFEPLDKCSHLKESK